MLNECGVQSVVVKIPILNISEYVKAEVVLAPPYKLDITFERQFDDAPDKIKKKSGNRADTGIAWV
jgi:hypothetical protein